MYLKILVLLITGGLGRTAVAAPILDQVFDDIGNLGNILGNTLAEGFAYAAQSVTAGVSADLVRVDLNAGRNANFTTPWELQILRAVNGLPSGIVLGSQIIDLPVNTGTDWRSYDLQVPVQLQAGEQFVLALHPLGVTGNPGLFAGIWHGGTDDPYTRGRHFYGTDVNAIFGPEIIDPGCSPGCQSWDLNFRTYMASEVPEASTLLLVSLGVLLVGARLVRRLQ